MGSEDTSSTGSLVNFDPEMHQEYSPVSKHSWISLVPACRSFSTRTDDVDIGVGSGGAIVVVAEGEGKGVLVGERGLGTDTPKTPRGVGPVCVHEYNHMF